MSGDGINGRLRRRYGRKAGVIHSCRYVVSSGIRQQGLVAALKRCGQNHKTRAHEKKVGLS